MRSGYSDTSQLKSGLATIYMQAAMRLYDKKEGDSITYYRRELIGALRRVVTFCNTARYLI